MPERKKILYMDDEESIRKLAEKIMDLLGFDITTSSDGKDAVDIYEGHLKNGSSFDCVILDLTVPGGMGGKEAAEKILELNPSAKIIISSGYSNDPIMSDFAEYGLKGIVMKPFKIEEIKDIIKKVLDND